MCAFIIATSGLDIISPSLSLSLSTYKHTYGKELPILHTIGVTRGQEKQWDGRRGTFQTYTLREREPLVQRKIVWTYTRQNGRRTSDACDMNGTAMEHVRVVLRRNRVQIYIH